MLKCYRCGGEMKRMRSRIVSEYMTRCEYVCRMCGTRVNRKEQIDQKAVKRIMAFKETARLQKELKDYCKGDNCLSCKFTRCKHDVTDGTSAHRKAV